MMIWRNIARAGLLPQFLNENDPRGAVAQINEAYAHGGGWHEFEGFKLVWDHAWHIVGLAYPEDPTMWELSRCQFRDELVVLCESDWVAVIQKNGAFNVARID
jgi:hypothetical protein